MCIFAVVDSTCFQLLFETDFCSELKVAIAGMEIDNYNIYISVIVVLNLFFNPLKLYEL